MNCVNIVYGCMVIFACLSVINCQLQSPCPNVFEYQYSTTNNGNELYGFIQAPFPNDNSNVIELEVQMSVGNHIQGFNGNIQLAAPHSEIVSDLTNGRPLRYILYFPEWRNIPPSITRLLINGRQICSGNPINSHSVPVVTTINLKHSLTVTIPKGHQPLNNWQFLPNEKPQSPSKNSPFYFVLGAPAVQSMPSNSFNSFLKNPFLNQPVSGNKQQAGPLFNPANNAFSNQNPPFSLSNIYVGDTANTNLGPDTAPPPSTQNKPTPVNRGEWANSAPQPPRDQSDDLPTVESNLVTGPPLDLCGTAVNSNTLLINGNRFAKGLHPWLAALFMQNEEGLKFMCGSSLISQRHVITAAHCIRNKRRKFNPEELWTVLGRENIQRWSNDGAQIIQAESTHYYPDHQFHTADADIAIIVLSEAAVFTTLVRPVCLWTGNSDENLIVGQNGTVVGWGKDEQGRVFTPQPRQVTMPVVSEETCLRSNPGFREITSNRTFCAGNRDQSGPCNGDSGSGLLLKRFGRWYLRGVVSMSLLGQDGTCDLRQYIVFTDAAKYTDWIRSFVARR